MDAEDELSQLEALLALEDPGSDTATGLKEIDIFNQNDDKASGSSCEQDASVLRSKDEDSSDDEEKRNCMAPTYSEYGSDIKQMLDREADEKKNKMLEFETRLRDANVEIKVKNQRKHSIVQTPTVAEQNKFKSPPKPDVYADPVFGIRIVRPLISSTALLDRMQGREAISMLRVKRHTEHGDLSKDWVVAGVVVRSSGTRKSQKGSQFIIWTLSDLKDDLKTVSLFLFRKAYSDLWKTKIGTVVGVLNPSVLDRTEDRVDQACLSTDSSDKVMIIGHSKDYGVCKSTKKNGEPCTAFINKNQCEHCIYHVKQEYQKFSKRQELQSATMGKGLVSLQNKVFGKGTVIYGGKEYSALPRANNQKIIKKDQNRLMSLSDYYKTENNLIVNSSPFNGPIKKNAVTVSATTSQKIKDLNRLDLLQKTTNMSTDTKPLNPGPSTVSPSLAERVAASARLSQSVPRVGFSLNNSGPIDLNVSYGQKAIEQAKINAAKLIQKHGGLGKNDPHNLKGTQQGKKRALESLNKSSSDSENDLKKSKPENNEMSAIKLKSVTSERFKKILEATSAHQNLIDQHDESEQEKYFGKLEKKEAMEEKMLNTFKVACKAVRCIKCKYTSFSAADHCKQEKHPLKVFDSFKRFFKCSDCANRTVSLELIPLHSCNKCKGSRWVKAPMLREKKAALTEGLSLRGEEETYIGGTIAAGKNINLLVPEE